MWGHVPRRASLPHLKHGLVVSDPLDPSAFGAHVCDRRRSLLPECSAVPLGSQAAVNKGNCIPKAQRYGHVLSRLIW